MIDSQRDVPVDRVERADAKKVPEILQLFPSDNKTLITGKTWKALRNLHKGQAPSADFDPIEALALKYLERTEKGLALTLLGRQGVEARLTFEQELRTRVKRFEGI